MAIAKLMKWLCCQVDAIVPCFLQEPKIWLVGNERTDCPVGICAQSLASPQAYLYVCTCADRTKYITQADVLCWFKTSSLIL